VTGIKQKPTLIDGKAILWSKYKKHYLNLQTADEAKAKKIPMAVQFTSNLAFVTPEQLERIQKTRAWRLGIVFRINKIPKAVTPITVVSTIDSGSPLTHSEATVKEIEDLRTENAINDAEFESLSKTAADAVIGDLAEEERMKEARAARVLEDRQ